MGGPTTHRRDGGWRVETEGKNKTERHHGERHHGERHHGERHHGERHHGERHHGERHHGEEEGLKTWFATASSASCEASHSL